MDKPPKCNAKSKQVDEKEKNTDFLCMKFKLKFYGNRN